MSSAEIPVADETHKKGDYEQREENDLAPGENERQQRQQQSHRRQ
jgi:hypothetical protein